MASTGGAVKAVDHSDKSEYSNRVSRLRGVMGAEALAKLTNSSVLIIGLGGLGVEIAKNVILTGVKSCTLFDKSPATHADLASQFYISERAVGQPRAAACLKQLQTLNPYTAVSVHNGEIDHAFLKQFTVVVATECSYERQLSINDFCHNNGIKFISTDVAGVFGRCFCDFGPEFTVVDTNGIAASECVLSNIVVEGDVATVTVHEEKRHELADGDFVTFKEIFGTTQLNSCEPKKVTVVDGYSFKVSGCTGFGAYVEKGIMTQIKQPTVMKFRSFKECLASPGEFMIYDYAKFDSPGKVHLAFGVLDEFHKTHGNYPEPFNAEHEKEFLAIGARMHQAAEGPKAELDDGAKHFLTEMCRTCRGRLNPLCAVFGGYVGQEVLKACSAKFTPTHQFLYMDFCEMLPSRTAGEPFAVTCAADVAPMGNRYDGQTAVIGHKLQAAVLKQNFFLVGAGAIGCEMLKNWALMGVGCAEGGHVTVTDMDCIEKSNLNRQFLFRPGDVKQLKSQCAARAVVAMNPAVHITALDLRVGGETETVFNDAFYSNLSAVCTALDNVDARLYVDQRCLFYQLPMMESGTEGPKGNTQIVVPRATENYGASRDPPEKSIPICTLKNFPNAIEHTLQWARDWFEGVFNQTAADANAYLSQAGFVAQLQAQQNTKLDTLERIHASLVTDKAIAFEDCVAWARLRFESMFASDMKQLLHNFPLDQVTASGQPFWSGTKRPPTPMAFDAEDPLHMAFIVAAANLRAENFGLAGSRDPAVLKPILAGVAVPEFVPRRGLKIAATEAEAKEQGGAAAAAAGGLDVDSQCDKILSELPPPGELAGFRLAPVEFEKDDDAHMDMITACSNLRARNYKITEADKHKSKLIAGKIIPAIATTTALVTGLVCLEAYKLMMKKPVEAYRNNFVNLALGFMASSEPQPVETQVSLIKGKEWKWSVWDCIDVDKGDITMGEFIEYFEEEYELDVSMVSFGVSILFSFFGNAKKMKERRKMKMSEVVAEVTKKPVNPTAMYLIFELCVSDASGGDNDGEDVDIPYVRMKIK